MKKKLVLSEMLVCLLTLSLSLLGCPTDGGDDGDGNGNGNGNGNGGGNTGATATISMADLGNNSFTLTLTGATWKESLDLDANLLSGKTGSLLDWENITSNGSWRIIWSCIRTSETVLTVTISKDQQYSGSGTGTVTLRDNDHWASAQSGKFSTYGAYILRIWTNEGEQAWGDDGQYSYGTLTVAEGSAAPVTITINEGYVNIVYCFVSSEQNVLS
jgi:hypothetical protein